LYACIAAHKVDGISFLVLRNAAWGMFYEADMVCFGFMNVHGEVRAGAVLCVWYGLIVKVVV